MGVPENEKLAIEYFARAAEAGNTEAMYIVACAYISGYGGQQDVEQAELWLVRGADCGHIPSMSLYGCYLVGEGETEEALGWLEPAATAGDVAAMAALGTQLVFYRTDEASAAEGIKWLKLVAGASESEDNRDAIADAMHALGLCYRGDASGVEVDLSEAKNWLELAADKGNADAMWELGYLYFYGEGVEQDYAAARIWYQASAENGNVDAMVMLWSIYRNGLGVEQDEGKAQEWLEAIREIDPERAEELLATPSDPQLSSD